MSIQVNIFEAGSVPTAQELVALINELNTSLDESVTLTGEQSITGVKTFLGSKLIKFKQSASADKLGFTLYDYQSKEVGNFEYDNKSNFRLLALGNYVSAANQEVECNIGFKIYNKLQGAAYRLLCPLAGNAKNSIPSLSETYTNFYIPLIFTNGAASVMADNNGKVDLSTLIGSGGGGGDISGLATVATTGDYNDLLNRPILFSGNYNDLTNKPTLFSGSYGDLTDKPTLFSGDYNDLTNKPTIPVVDITKAQADEWYQPIGDYALTTDLFSGSYNDLTDKPSLFSGNYNDLTNKPSLFSGSYNDLTDKPTLFSGDYTDLTNKPTIPINLSDLSDDSTHRLVTDTEKATWDNKSNFSGSYNDLIDKPTIPNAQVNSDWNSSSGVSQILNKPNLATVATSGSYNDLSNKPTIPTVPAISTNITSDAASDTKTASPKAVKDFVEGKGYLTQHQDISGKADQTDLEALEDRVDAIEQGGSSITVDTQLNSVSTNPVENAALYDELRITEQSDSPSVTIDGTTYPIEVIDADDFNTYPDSDYTIYTIPPLDTDKAYKIIHADNIDFIASESATYILRFCGNNANDFNLTHVGIAEIGGEVYTGASINSEEYWNTITFDEEIVYSETSFYGIPVDGQGEKITRHEEATETTGSISTIKSLKQKITELEVKIAQISAQLQS